MYYAALPTCLVGNYNITHSEPCKGDKWKNFEFVLKTVKMGKNAEKRGFAVPKMNGNQHLLQLWKYMLKMEKYSCRIEKTQEGGVVMRIIVHGFRQAGDDGAG